MYPKLFGVLDSYATMMFLGVILGVTLFEIYFRKHLKESRRIFYLEVPLLAAIILGMAGAYLFQNLYDFIEDPAHFKWSWSLTFLGGLLTAVVAFFVVFFLYSRKRYPEGLKPFFRIFPASLVGGHALGRIGCFLEGCCYGVPTDAWFGVKFTTTATKVVPTNLFEACFLFVLFAVFAFLAFKKEKASDFSMPAYMLAYGAWRFGIEYVRGDHRGELLPGLSPSQFWSLLLMVGGAVYLGILIYREVKKSKEKPAS